MDLTWQSSVDIAAPVDKVYAYLADFPKHCEWAQTLESMEQKKAGDASGVGAIYRTKEKQALQADRPPRGPLPEKAGGGTVDCEVTELVPNSRIAWKAHPVPIRFPCRDDIRSRPSQWQRNAAHAKRPFPHA